MNEPPCAVLLVAMPFHDLVVPSIQLGTLKGILDRAGIAARTRHYQIDFVERCMQATAGCGPEAQIGPPEYLRIGDDYYRLGLGDWVFAGAPLWTADPERDRDYLERVRAEGVPERIVSAAVRMREIAPDFLDFLQRCADDLFAARRSAYRTQLRSVSAAHPIFSAIEVIAAHCDAWSWACSNTIRTARSRTSGENRLDLAMTPSSQGMEPPRNPGRFIPSG